MKCDKHRRLSKFFFSLLLAVISLFNGIPYSMAATGNWQSSTSIQLTSLYGDAYGNGTFVAVGSGILYKNSSGWVGADVYNYNWELNGSFEAVTFGGGQFVAVGDHGMIYSSTDGKTWKSQTVSDSTYISPNNLSNSTLTGIAYSDKTNMFVAVGTGDVSGSIILTSTDGSDWRSQNAPDLANLQLKNVAYGNGEFVALDGYYSGAILTSADGSNWTETYSGNTNLNTNGDQITFGNNKFVVLEHYIDSSTWKKVYLLIVSNDNGQTWSSPQVVSAFGGMTDLSGNNDFTYANGLFVLVSRRDDEIFTSSDLVNWTGQPVMGGPDVSNILLEGVTYGNGEFVATGILINNEFNTPSLFLTAFSPTVTLQSSRNPSYPDQSVAFTASVPVPGDSALGQPTGTVTFTNGATALGTANLDASSGQASITVSGLSLGNHSITAEYSGDFNYFNSTSAPIVQTVNARPTLTGITLDTDSYTLSVENTHQTVVTAVYSDSSKFAVNSGVTFSVSDPSIVSVDANGLVTAKAAGQTVVTAAYQDQSAQATVTVTAANSGSHSSSSGGGGGSSGSPISGNLGGGGTQKNPFTALIGDNKLAATLTDVNGNPVNVPEISIDSQGNFSINTNLQPGQYTMNVHVVSPSGQELAGTTAQLTVNGNRQVDVHTASIDPYGIVKDAATNQPLDGVNVQLYWADTQLNRDNGRTPGTVVDLPELPNFAPNQNHNPQVTKNGGQYGWVVYPKGDYYILAQKDGYETYDSRKDTRSLAFGDTSYLKDGILHVGETVIHYDFSMIPLAIQTHQAYMFGYPDGTFGPDRSITRAEMAAMLARILQYTNSAATVTNSYSDVPAAHWAAKSIAAMTAHGMMSGYPDGSFHPDAPITRAEMASLIQRVKKLTPSQAAAFTDTATNWAQAAIGAVEQAGIIQGYPDGSFHPEQNLSRAEAVTMINKMLGRGPLEDVKTPTWPDVPTTYWGFGEIEEASINHSYTRLPDGNEQYCEFAQ
ncbi:S-layer homology domain-containing protein [Fodinisporobacter ferrooxydans]|uniref:S-layer homology domain-containing protein n=1 Tax=Fodinisporobacter ferrooxydans TaxID=2901836 RepID=A0ABY4CPB3_9BACL|nr:S-layer homology domain-containing protein [Alicyclobacillaceae bacterium MYW30-H2]